MQLTTARGITGLTAACGLALLPLAASAADLSGGPIFVEETFTPTIERTAVGHLELALGITDHSGGDGGFAFAKDNAFEGWGRANVPLGGYLNLELEAGGIAFFEDGSSNTGYGAYGHLWAGWQAARLGVFGGAGFHGMTIGTVGAEGEVDLGPVTLGAQGSYNFADQSAVPGSEDYFWGVRGWVDLYITPDTKLGGEVGWWAIEDFLGPLGSGMLTLSGRAEHRFAGSPISIFARVDYWDIDGTDANALVASGGIRVFLDGRGTSLTHHDRCGVPFDFRNGVGEFLTFIDVQSLANQ